MRTTLDLPDDLYALVKARAALEGRTLRSVVEELLKGWVGAASEPTGDPRGPATVAEPKVGYGGRTRRRAAHQLSNAMPTPKGESGADGEDELKGHREHLRNLMRYPKSLDELGELLKGPASDMELSAMRELYQKKLAEEWKRRHP